MERPYQKNSLLFDAEKILTKLQNLDFDEDCELDELIKKCAELKKIKSQWFYLMGQLDLLPSCSAELPVWWRWPKFYINIIVVRLESRCCRIIDNSEGGYKYIRKVK